MWSFFDPLFASSFIFFRILSACLYFSFAVASSEERHDPQSGSLYYLKGSPNSVESPPSDGTANSTAGNVNPGSSSVSLEKGNKGLLDFMLKRDGNVDVQKRDVEHKMKIYHDHERGSTYCYFSVVSGQQQLNNTRRIYTRMLAIPFVTIPIVAYDVFVRDAGIEQEHSNSKKSTVEMVVNTAMIGFLGILIGWRLVSGTYRSPCCCRCDPIGCVKYCYNGCMKVMRRTLCNVEGVVFLAFSAGGIVFYITEAVLYEKAIEHKNVTAHENVTKQERPIILAADSLGSFAVLLHSIFIVSTNFSGHQLERFKRGVHSCCNFLITLPLAVLFALTLASLGIDIEREHHDDLVHHSPRLRGIAPLIVDFRVHAAILTYNVLAEFHRQRITKKEVDETFKKSKPAGKENSTEKCCMPRCSKKTKTEGSGSPANSEETTTGCMSSRCRSDAKVVLWKCSKEKCSGEHYFCDVCFKDFVTKLKECPTFLIGNNGSTAGERSEQPDTIVKTENNGTAFGNESGHTDPTTTPENSESPANNGSEPADLTATAENDESSANNESGPINPTTTVENVESSVNNESGPIDPTATVDNDESSANNESGPINPTTTVENVESSVNNESGPIDPTTAVENESPVNNESGSINPTTAIEIDESYVNNESGPIDPTATVDNDESSANNESGPINPTTTVENVESSVNNESGPIDPTATVDNDESSANNESGHIDPTATVETTACNGSGHIDTGTVESNA
jgi:hypothetical protein